MPSSCVARAKEIGNFDNEDLMAAKIFACWTTFGEEEYFRLLHVYDTQENNF